MHKIFRATGDYDHAPILEALIDNFGDDHDLVIAEAIQFFFLGFHTIGIYMIWVVHFLALHQDIQSKVLEELQQPTAYKSEADEDIVEKLP